MAAEPLIPDTGIEFLLASPHPFVEDGFDLYHDDQGEAALQFITLIPATRAEFEFLGEHENDADALLELWESRDTDLLDIYRASAV
jgi:hypothetical protein